MRTQIVYPANNSLQHEVNIDRSGSIVRKMGDFFPSITNTGFGDRCVSVLPYSINIFTTISKHFSLDTITDSSLKAKVLQILNALNEAIIGIPEINNTEQYLSKLHLVEQEDKSILIEWMYRDFRIGFVVCKPVDDSYYFFVSQNGDAFVSKSSKIGDNINILAHDIVQYVIRNT
jgi:hypothetical protein